MFAHYTDIFNNTFPYHHRVKIAVTKQWCGTESNAFIVTPKYHSKSKDIPWYSPKYVFLHFYNRFVVFENLYNAAHTMWCGLVFTLCLLSQRTQDHSISINLKDGTDPINVRPYCYPHSKKNEIEWLEKDMLKARIIHPFKSPFSSSVILVKKRDGSWHFCVDYRALNKATVPISTRYPWLTSYWTSYMVPRRLQSWTSNRGTTKYVGRCKMSTKQL